MNESDEFGITALSNGRTAEAVLDRAAAPAVTIQRMPVKIRRVELTDDYAGWWADMHMNPPMGIIVAMETGTALAVFEEFPKVIRAWNFGDADGAPLPVSAEGIRALPPDLLEALGKAWGEARSLPKTTSVT